MLHEEIAQLASPAPGSIVVDAGAGSGRTLAAIGGMAPRARLIAIDLDGEKLASAMATVPNLTAIRADLAGPLPIADRQVDVVISTNTLECLVDPSAALVEMARILRPTGVAVLAHTDFETIVVTASDRELSRRVLRTYADLPVPYLYMQATDAQLGRRLSGLVRRGPLRHESVQAHTRVVSSLAEAADLRLREVATAIRSAADQGLGGVTPTEVDRWWSDLEAADAADEFLFSETAYIVTARLPG